jgi:CCR4-NOT transcription complex subunit 1
MFKFGLTALDQFKSRLPEWPQYCSHILAIPSIRKVVPEIVEFIEKNLPALPPATAPPSGPAASGMGLPGMQGPMPGMNTPPVPKEAPKERLSPMEIMLKGVSPPPRIDENVADKIAFVFNNVSLSNMDQKVYKNFPRKFLQ